MAIRLTIGLAGIALIAAATIFWSHGSEHRAEAAGASVIGRYCMDCHNDIDRAGDLALDALDLKAPAAAPRTWEAVVRKLRTGMMPPAGEPRPEREALDALAAYLERHIDAVAMASPNPGAPALHRLNRTEYANVVRDLLAIDIDVETLLPADDAAEGFDNIAGVLTVSPSLIEGYVAAGISTARPWMSRIRDGFACACRPVPSRSRPRSWTVRREAV